MEQNTEKYWCKGGWGIKRKRERKREREREVLSFFLSFFFLLVFIIFYFFVLVTAFFFSFILSFFYDDLLDVVLSAVCLLHFLTGFCLMPTPAFLFQALLKKILPTVVSDAWIKNYAYKQRPLWFIWSWILEEHIRQIVLVKSIQKRSPWA